MTRHVLMKRTDGLDPISRKAKTNGRRKLLKANDRRGGEIMYDVDTGPKRYFLEAQNVLKGNDTLREPRSHEDLRKFAMEIDENGVLRLKGRIKAAKMCRLP
ncbi:hypothetical protein EVAR_41021_1 [Eumeta japonica]|uniref:Uncharacterized protein n=1 Tax=Eumeta variegata TaxID=151549 RepID=A0A4C1Z338_EUMVA|nr:hypothetical protein EVAR_41021_1 [Eumeta japonica]